MMEAPFVNVGILSDKELTFVFDGSYVHTETGAFPEGECRAVWQSGKILFNGRLYEELFFEPSSPSASFQLKGVVIGVDFHWERKEDQSFHGALNLVVDQDTLVAINQVDVEAYLASVISSEMSATASKEFLKAHAVISRSWLLAQIGKNGGPREEQTDYRNGTQNAHRLVRWYDREDHTLFDVCADDHCQRYQGITRTATAIAQQAVDETRGEILTAEGIICDTRFSKCCGGVTERFETCWEPVPHTYLTAVRDSAESLLPDLTLEAEAEQWIRSSPEAFCHTRDKRILVQVLNNYDQETTDFFRWQVVYTQRELAELVARKTGMDFGDIIDLVPVQRGSSGRMEALTIVGTRQTYTIGKELEIRRTLSESHLYSSAFIVDKEEGGDGVPQRFVLTGAGWGHGVGLCQIGAAVMGDRGCDYRHILRHYYPGAEIEKRYE